MTDNIQPANDPSTVPAEDETAQPIPIRKLDRLETTHQTNPSGA